MKLLKRLGRQRLQDQITSDAAFAEFVKQIAVEQNKRTVTRKRAQQQRGMKKGKKA